MTWLEEEIVVTNAAAIRMRVSQLVGSGKELEAAKTDAIRGYYMGAIPPGLRRDVINLVEVMRYSDLSPCDLEAISKAGWESSIKAGVPDTWYNRMLWRWFGLTW